MGECKEKWKNLRAVFVRHMKPASSGSGTKKKPYYLAEAMQFTIPYIKTLSSTTGNVPNIPEENENQEFKENDELHDSQPLSPPQPSTPNIPITSVTSQPYFTQYAKSTETQSQPTTRPKNKRAFKYDAVDKTFIEYLEAKKAKIDRDPDRNTKQNTKTEALKRFLLSMISDLELMNDDQIRTFKRTCLQTIDNILSLNSYNNYSPVASVDSLVSQATTHRSYSVETPHTSRSVSDSASVTHIPQYESIETSQNSQITAADKYYNVVKEVFTENYEPYNTHQSLQ